MAGYFWRLLVMTGYRSGVGEVAWRLPFPNVRRLGPGALMRDFHPASFSALRKRASETPRVTATLSMERSSPPGSIDVCDGALEALLRLLLFLLHEGGTLCRGVHDGLRNHA